MAAALTLLAGFVLLAPIIGLALIVALDAHLVTDFIAQANNSGIAAPAWLIRLPFGSSYLLPWWNMVFGTPHALSENIHEIFNSRLSIIGATLTATGTHIGHLLLMTVFTLLLLFFLFRDGHPLLRQINRIGERWLGDRWHLYASTIPMSVRATVNGIVLVGIAEGVCLGIAYAAVGLGPNSISLGALTAALAMIPFGAPLIFGGVGLYLLANSQILDAVIIFAVGLIVLFVADHIARPLLIGNAAKLPFVLILVGIIGGLEAFGLVGLFVGPVFMGIALTLWREAQGLESD